MSNVIRALVVAAVAGTMTFATACERPQPDVREQVNRSLEEANLGHVDVDWDDDARVAHLRGQVNTTDERERAENIAREAVGTAGTVLNELTVEEDWGERDRQIRDHLNQMVENDPQLSERNIDFDVNNGAVSVTGTVATEAERERINEIVQGAPHVRDFANRLEIEPQR